MMMLALLGSSKYSQYEYLFEKLKRRKVTVAQIHLMLILASQGNEWLSLQDLTKELQKKSKLKSATAVTRMIQNLRAKNRYGRDGHDFLEIMKEEDERFLMLRLNKRGFHFLDSTLNI